MGWRFSPHILGVPLRTIARQALMTRLLVV
jgi:hypothetical protein